MTAFLAYLCCACVALVVTVGTWSAVTLTRAWLRERRLARLNRTWPVERVEEES